MSRARLTVARCTRADFIGREHRAWLERAFVAMLVADEPPRRVGTPEMRRALNALIHGARRAVMFADGLPTAHAARYFIDTNMLTPAAFALRDAVAAEAALPARRRHGRQGRMLFADLAAADHARDDAFAAGEMIAFDAGGLVLSAVGLVARDAGARVLGAGRMTIDVTRTDPVIPAEVLVAHAAGQRARVARYVSRLAHREPANARRTALRTGKSPVAGAVEPPLREQWRTNAAPTDQLPLRALNEHLAFGELHRMHDRAHLMSTLFLGAPTSMLGFDWSSVVAFNGVAA
jgi:hypothetical protein